MDTIINALYSCLGCVVGLELESHVVQDEIMDRGECAYNVINDTFGYDRTGVTMMHDDAGEPAMIGIVNMIEDAMALSHSRGHRDFTNTQ